MGKRSKFKRNPRDLYITPLKALLPLLPFLCPKTKFIEPCAADGQLVGFLQEEGHICQQASDIVPLKPHIMQADALSHIFENPSMFITNPPWTRVILHALIRHLSDQAPTWLLFDSDWKETNQAHELMERCHMIIAVGRVKWIPNSKSAGKENCAWYLFDKRPRTTMGPILIGLKPKPKKTKLGLADK